MHADTSRHAHGHLTSCTRSNMQAYLSPSFAEQCDFNKQLLLWVRGHLLPDNLTESRMFEALRALAAAAEDFEFYVHETVISVSSNMCVRVDDA